MRRLNSAARMDSLNGGAAISQMDFCCETVQALSALIVARIGSIDWACAGAALKSASITVSWRLTGYPSLPFFTVEDAEEQMHRRRRRGDSTTREFYALDSLISSHPPQLSSASSAVQALDSTQMHGRRLECGEDLDTRRELELLGRSRRDRRDERNAAHIHGGACDGASGRELDDGRAELISDRRRGGRTRERDVVRPDHSVGRSRDDMPERVERDAAGCKRDGVLDVLGVRAGAPVGRLVA